MHDINELQHCPIEKEAHKAISSNSKEGNGLHINCGLIFSLL